MPVESGEYSQMSEDAVIDALESEFAAEFGFDIDLTESSVFSTLAEVHGQVASSNQEQSLQEVYQSGFLDTAEGQDLDRVVAIIGIQRRPSIHATGAQRFVSDGRVTQDYTIQRGTLVQTDSETPIQFETAEVSHLRYIDGFESNSLTDYTGDAGDFDTVSTHPSVGAHELRAAAVSGSHLYHSDETLEEGSEYHVDVYPEANTIPAITFGIQSVGNHYQAVVDTNAGELRIEKVESGSVTQTIDSASFSIPSGEYLEAELDWNLTGHIGFTVTDSDGNEYSVGGKDTDSSRWRSGNLGFKSLDANGQKYWDEAAMGAVTADTRAVVGGGHANVGSNAITVMPSPPAGVDSTENLYPTGDPDYTNPEGDPFIVGRNRETDEELRTRARESVSSGGDATHDAITSALLNEIEGVTSVTIYENKSEDDNTGSGGLPPYSFEAVVFGGDELDVAETIHSKKALTSRDYGGAHGTEVTRTVTAESNGQQFTITFSRPTGVAVDLTMDLVVNDTYIGDEALTNRLVEYIGGQKADGSDAVGLGVGEDVMMDQIEDLVVGADDTGVVGFDANASSYDIDSTPSTTTNSNGLEVISIGQNEVAETDAADGSITINTTEV